jgi:phage recombination protein Bet
MTTDVVTRERDSGDALFTPEQVQILKRQFLNPRDREPTDDELAIFLYQCERTRLDPFARQIYAVYRWDARTRGERMGVETTIDGFRLVAERSGKYDGQTAEQWCGPDGEWRDVWLASDPPAAAKVGVWKSGAREPTYAVATFAEYAQRNTKTGALIGLWPTMPANQLSKCAEAKALRKAFPRELSGLYTREEMAQADNPPPGASEPVSQPREHPPARDLTREDVSAVAKASAPPVEFRNEHAAGPVEIVDADFRKDREAVAAEHREDPTPDKSSTPETIAKTKAPEGMRDPDSPAGDDEIAALRELIKVTNTHEGFVRMALIDFGIDDVGEVDDLLPRLTVAQALHVMNRINERAN